MSIFNTMIRILPFANKPIENVSPRLPALDDPYKLPSHTAEFKEWHIKLLRRLDKHPKNESLSGIITKEIDIPRFIPILEDLHLITTSSYLGSLSLLKVEELKMILKEHEIKISGKKQELIKRIISNINEVDVQKSISYTDFYLLTDLGRFTIRESSERLEQEHLCFFKNVLDAIVNLNLAQAHRMICKHNAEKPIPPGLGVDWKKRYIDGLNHHNANQYKYQINSSKNPYITAAAIYADISGESFHKVEALFAKAYPNLEPFTKYINQSK